MTTKDYLTGPKSATKELKLARERELFRKKAQDGGPYSRYWLKCADIAYRIDHDLPVGHMRRKRQAIRASKGVSNG